MRTPEAVCQLGDSPTRTCGGAAEQGSLPAPLAMTDAAAQSRKWGVLPMSACLVPRTLHAASEAC
jgi:hypothetical protein